MADTHSAYPISSYEWYLITFDNTLSRSKECLHSAMGEEGDIIIPGNKGGGGGGGGAQKTPPPPGGGGGPSPLKCLNCCPSNAFSGICSGSSLTLLLTLPDAPQSFLPATQTLP
jgi:hypothetical protein